MDWSSWGVYAPEFEFEKDYDNVLAATQSEGLVWPTAQDNDCVTWRRYPNRFWPSKYLINKDGVVRPILAKAPTLKPKM